MLKNVSDFLCFERIAADRPMRQFAAPVCLTDKRAVAFRVRNDRIYQHVRRRITRYSLSERIVGSAAVYEDFYPTLAVIVWIQFLRTVHRYYSTLR